jgi:hypothetical protein
MEQTNLAAVILRLARRELTAGQFDGDNGSLTEEEAIKLADWLQPVSSLNAWRQIHLGPNSAGLKSNNRSTKARAPGRCETLRRR